MSRASHRDDADMQRRRAEFERRIQQQIDTVGWFIVQTWLPGAQGDNVPISYTIGLTERDRPELCIVGVDPDTSASVLDELARRTTTRDGLTHGQRINDVLDGFDLVIVEGPATGIVRPTIALHRYGLAAVRLQQCVWPDPRGIFPWEAGYRMPPIIQPIIARPIA